MTNILELLHTTAAYQAAVVHLMIGQANLTADELRLADWQPIHRTNELQVMVVDPPPRGVSGEIQTTNYNFTFKHGLLTWIGRVGRAERLNNNWMTPPELTRLKSQVDERRAYQLATQWVSHAGVDVGAMEQKYRATIRQTWAPGTAASSAAVSGKLAAPLFQIAWGAESTNQLTMFMAPVSLELRGDTKELWRLSINDRSLLTNRALQVVNRRDLLGPMPPPGKFIEDMVGGHKACEIINSAQEIRISLLDRSEDNSGMPGKVRGIPQSAAKLQRDSIKRIISDVDSYAWMVQKMCEPVFGVRVEFVRADETVSLLICFDCGILQFSYGNFVREESFDPSFNELLGFVTSVFPRDPELKKIERHTREERQNYRDKIDQFIYKD